MTEWTKIRLELHDLNGRRLRVGDLVRSYTGKQAVIKFGQYTHYIGELDSPAFGVYFDGDDEFYFSEHLKPGGAVTVIIMAEPIQPPMTDEKGEANDG